MSESIAIVSLAVSVLTLIVTCLAMYLAWRIPHQIMTNQMFAELIARFPDGEIGFAMKYVFDFFEKECSNVYKNISSKYRERYYTDFPDKCPYKTNCEGKNICDAKTKKEEGEEFGAYKKTLHFQRRLLDQYFWLIGELAFGSTFPVHLPRRALRAWFTKGEYKLLTILSEMNKAEDKIRKTFPKPRNGDEKNYKPDGEGLMWKIRKRLWQEGQHWRP